MEQRSAATRLRLRPDATVAAAARPLERFSASFRPPPPAPPSLAVPLLSSFNEKFGRSGVFRGSFAQAGGGVGGCYVLSLFTSDSVIILTRVLLLIAAACGASLRRRSCQRFSSFIDTWLKMCVRPGVGGAERGLGAVCCRLINDSGRRGPVLWRPASQVGVLTSRTRNTPSGADGPPPQGGGQRAAPLPSLLSLTLLIFLVHHLSVNTLLSVCRGTKRPGWKPSKGS